MKVYCDGILRGVGVLSNFLQIEYKIKSSIVILNSGVWGVKIEIWCDFWLRARFMISGLLRLKLFVFEDKYNF